MAQLVGHRPAKQKVAGLIPGQGTCLGCGLGPWAKYTQGPRSGHMREATDQYFFHIDVSLPLFLPPFPCL